LRGNIRSPVVSPAIVGTAAETFLAALPLHRVEVPCRSDRAYQIVRKSLGRKPEALSEPLLGESLKRFLEQRMESVQTGMQKPPHSELPRRPTWWMKGKATSQTKEEHCAEWLVVGRRRPGPGISVMPQAVVRGCDGYLRVLYHKVGPKFRSYDQWIAGSQRSPNSESWPEDGMRKRKILSLRQPRQQIFPEPSLQGPPCLAAPFPRQPRPRRLRSGDRALFHRPGI
jgi:hypothetical protein